MHPESGTAPIPEPRRLIPIFFFFNDTATPEIYTLSLHDALPIYYGILEGGPTGQTLGKRALGIRVVDRKSTRLNSSHVESSDAVFCLKKTKKRFDPCAGQYKYNRDVEADDL